MPVTSKPPLRAWSTSSRSEKLAGQLQRPAELNLSWHLAVQRPCELRQNLVWAHLLTGLLVRTRFDMILGARRALSMDVSRREEPLRGREMRWRAEMELVPA